MLKLEQTDTQFDNSCPGQLLQTIQSIFEQKIFMSLLRQSQKKLSFRTNFVLGKTMI